MNYGIIFYLAGWIMLICGCLMAVPLLTAVIYMEKAGFAFLITMVFSILAGTLIIRKKPRNKVFYIRESYIAVAVSWLLLSLVGCVPFILTGSIPSFINALFETVSGFTTTGASILSAVEGLPRSILIWRSFTHWIGGMGVLVFLLTLIPLTGGFNMGLMKAESPGPSVSRLVPKVRTTAVILYQIYFVLTLTQVALLLLGGLPLYDCLCLSFGTAGTGGFGILNDSFGSYSSYIQIVTTIFMILFGVNFNVYFFIKSFKIKSAFLIEEFRYYLCTILIAVVLITANVRSFFPTLGETIKHAAFQVGSIITTTGFSTADFDQWPSFSKTILVMLMFCGACAGSTGGGIKVSRLAMLVKSVSKEIQIYLHPNIVKKVKMDGKVVPHETMRATNIFLTVYIVIFAASVLIISLDNFDVTTNFTAVAATINNIGPGLSKVGPACNFDLFSTPSKLILIFDMLAGRLEIIPLLMFITPRTWKRF